MHYCHVFLLDPDSQDLAVPGALSEPAAAAVPGQTSGSDHSVLCLWSV